MEREMLMPKRDQPPAQPLFDAIPTPSLTRASRYSLIILNDKWNIYQFKIDERVAARSPLRCSSV